MFGATQQLPGILGRSAKPVDLLIKRLPAAGGQVDGTGHAEDAVICQRPSTPAERSLGSLDLLSGGEGRPVGIEASIYTQLDQKGVDKLSRASWPASGSSQNGPYSDFLVWGLGVGEYGSSEPWPAPVKALLSLECDGPSPEKKNCARAALTSSLTGGCGTGSFSLTWTAHAVAYAVDASCCAEH